VQSGKWTDHTSLCNRLSFVSCHMKTIVLQLILGQVPKKLVKPFDMNARLYGNFCSHQDLWIYHIYHPELQIQLVHHHSCSFVWQLLNINKNIYSYQYHMIHFSNICSHLDILCFCKFASFVSFLPSLLKNWRNIL